MTMTRDLIRSDAVAPEATDGRRAHRVRSAVCLWLAAALLPGLVSAQSLREQTSAARSSSATGPGPTQVLSINPFMPILGLFQGEYERRLQDNLAIAVAGSYAQFDDYYTNLDAKLRLYPQERGMQGMGLAAGLGFGQVRRRHQDTCDDLIEVCTPVRRTETAPTFSVEGHYQWLLGSGRATAVTLGGGVKRYFIGDAHASGINRVLPTLRLTVGYAWQ